MLDQDCQVYLTGSRGEYGKSQMVIRVLVFQLLIRTRKHPRTRAFKCLQDSALALISQIAAYVESWQFIIGWALCLTHTISVVKQLWVGNFWKRWGLTSLSNQINWNDIIWGFQHSEDITWTSWEEASPWSKATCSTHHIWKVQCCLSRSPGGASRRAFKSNDIPVNYNANESINRNAIIRIVIITCRTVVDSTRTQVFHHFEGYICFAWSENHIDSPVFLPMGYGALVWLRVIDWPSDVFCMGG